MSKHWWVLLMGLFASCSGWAASFDCKKASTTVEELICIREELSHLDDQLTITYRNALKAVSDPGLLKAEQREWLEKRNRCAGMSCLYDAYVQRVAQLFYYSQIDSEGNNSYKLVDDSCESESDAGKIRCGVCRAYLEVLNSLSEPVRCDIPANQDIGFRLVEMKPLDPWADPQLLYALDTFQHPTDAAELPETRGITRFKDLNFEQWLLAYRQKIASPLNTITPMLAEANMDLNNNGNMESVLGYTRYPEGCESNVIRGYSAAGGQYHLFVRIGSPPGFDVQAAKQMGLSRLFTPLRYRGQIYMGWSGWDPPISPNRISDVRLFETWGLPVHATEYCRFEMPLTSIKDNQGEGR